MGRLLKIFCCIASAAGISATICSSTHMGEPVSIAYPDYFGNRINIPADNPTTKDGILLGRMLFYEGELSGNNKISCATCHRQQLAFTDGKRFSAGFDDTLQLRNTMSLANLLWSRHFFWDGRESTLEKQAETPLTGLHEMGQSLSASAKKIQASSIYPPLFKKAFGTSVVTGENIVKALTQFERTLVSADSRYDQFMQGTYQPNASELNGLALFNTDLNAANHTSGAGCFHCHGGPKTFSDLMENNGLDTVFADGGREKITGQPMDRGRFKAPTLRNIALTAPYMHDGRFGTLQEVVAHYNDHVTASSTLSPFLRETDNSAKALTLNLSVQQQKDLLAFLNMLTDSTFITNPAFSNPFTKTRP